MGLSWRGVACVVDPEHPGIIVLEGADRRAVEGEGADLLGLEVEGLEEGDAEMTAKEPSIEF